MHQSISAESPVKVWKWHIKSFFEPIEESFCLHNKLFQASSENENFNYEETKLLPY
jgi:hypothetical protein